MRTGNANANADCYGDRHTYGDGNCHAHAECNSVTDTNGDGYNYSISDAYGYTKSHAMTSADSSSSAVWEALISVQVISEK
jgi:hypothetical protein